MVDDRGFGTRCIHAGEAPDPTTGAHGVPIYQNVTFAFETYSQIEAMRSGERPHFTYSPRGNPTVRCLEAKLANLEGAESAVALNSGMAAISGALSTLADGGHIIASDQLYDLTRSFLEHELPRSGGSTSFVDVSDRDAIAAAISSNTRAIYAEPCSNPNVKISDIRMLSEIARLHGLFLIVDNTFLSPALLRPIEFGADLVIHSATKYLSGNGQVQGGVVSGSHALINAIREHSLIMGTAISPFAAWVLLAGTHTLPLRMSRHAENAMRLARLLHSHPAVEKVNYPGLPSHAGHATAREMVGTGEDRFGGMLSFELQGGPRAVAAMVDSLSLCTIAVSLGDSSTLVWPWHVGNLVRVSTGLEDSRDLLHDFTQALSVLAPESA